jgi:hypothetical protein
LAQGFHIARRHHCRQGRQNADQWSAMRLLRARRERPRDRAAQEPDELAAFHSITSSATAWSLPAADGRTMQEFPLSGGYLI